MLILYLFLVSADVVVVVTSVVVETCKANICSETPLQTTNFKFFLFVIVWFGSLFYCTKIKIIIIKNEI